MVDKEPKDPVLKIFGIKRPRDDKNNEATRDIRRAVMRALSRDFQMQQLQHSLARATAFETLVNYIEQRPQLEASNEADSVAALHTSACLLWGEILDKTYETATPLGIPSDHALTNGRVTAARGIFSLRVGEVCLGDFSREQFDQPPELRKHPLVDYYNLLAKLLLVSHDPATMEEILAANRNLNPWLSINNPEMLINNATVLAQYITIYNPSSREYQLSVLKESDQKRAVQQETMAKVDKLNEQGIKFQISAFKALSNPDSPEYRRLTDAVAINIGSNRFSQMATLAVLTRGHPVAIGNLYRLAESYVDHSLDREFFQGLINTVTDVTVAENLMREEISTLTHEELPIVFEVDTKQSELNPSLTVEQVLEDFTRVVKLTPGKEFNVDPAVLEHSGIKEPASLQIVTYGDQVSLAFRINFTYKLENGKTLFFITQFHRDLANPQGQFTWNILPRPEKLEPQYQTTLRALKAVAGSLIAELEKSQPPEVHTNPIDVKAGAGARAKVDERKNALQFIELPGLGNVGVISKQESQALLLRHLKVKPGETPQSISQDFRELRERWLFYPNKSGLLYIAALHGVDRMEAAKRLGIDVILTRGTELTYIFDRRIADVNLGNRKRRAAFQCQLDPEGHISNFNDDYLNTILETIAWGLQTRTFFSLDNTHWTRPIGVEIEQIIKDYNKAKPYDLPRIKIATNDSLLEGQSPATLVPVWEPEYKVSVLTALA